VRLATGYIKSRWAISARRLYIGECILDDRMCVSCEMLYTYCDEYADFVYHGRTIFIYLFIYLDIIM